MPSFILHHLQKIDASKESLHEKTLQRNPEDAISQIYDIIKNELSKRNSTAVDYQIIEPMVLLKGFSSKQLRSCLGEYQSLGVIHVDENWNRITFQ